MFRTPRHISATTAAMAVAVAVLVGSTSALAASAGPPAPVIRDDGSAAAIPGSYVVALRDTASVRRQGIDGRARTLTQAHRGTLDQVWQHALRGFSVTLTRDQALSLAAEPDVAYVEADQRLANSVSVPGTPAGAQPNAGSQTPVTWSLDRIDQHALPLDNHYSFDETAGQGVHAYILSTGILVSHPDFGGRASGGGNFISDGRTSTTDCHGAGTRIAGVIGGTQFGVSKMVSMVSVRISNCSNVTTLAAVISGFDWVMANAVAPAIIAFFVLDYCYDNNGVAVACPPNVADALVNLQESAFLDGITVFGEAGDSSQDACAKATGAAPDTVYVGSTDANDARATTSNFGPCITMFAPGQGIATDDPATGTGVFTDSGFAAAYVAGAAALFAGKPEFAGATPDQIRDELVTNRSTPNVVTGLTPNTPNRLLFTGPPGFYTTGESASLAPTGDGRLELFGANKAGWLFHREQTAGGWSGWSQSATKGWLSVGAEPNADGRIALLGLTPSGEIWLREETTANSNVWSNWSRLSAPANAVPIARAVMAHNASNRLEIFATNHQGQAFYRSQFSPGSRLWTAWTPFSFAGKLRAITAVAYADGRIEVLAVDDAGQVWRTTQVSATDNNWSAFTKLDGFGVTSIAAARNTNGTLELVGLDAGGGAWHRTQTTVGTWGTWSPLNSATLAHITAETGSDGRILLVGVDNLGNIRQSTQTGANASTYTPWSPLDGQLRP